jgi:hypothetical protein
MFLRARDPKRARKLENYNYAKKPGKPKSTSQEGVRD